MFNIGDCVQIVGKVDGYPMKYLPWDIGDIGYIRYIADFARGSKGYPIRLSKTSKLLDFPIEKNNGAFFEVDLILIEKNGQLPLPFKFS